MDILHKAQHVHFIGIGGIGISAIARMLIKEGKWVSGSDKSASDITEDLAKAGATIYIGQKAENIATHCDLVIYTVAIPEDNPELALAKHRGIPLMTYPQTLKIISAEKYTIAVSGTHGKTTTTAMIGTIFINAGLDPTILVGSLMKDPRQKDQIGTNFISGTSNYFIVEADEYKKSFHNLSPSLLVINNLDEDHLDFYKDLADIQAAFHVLASRVPADGYVVCDPHDPHVAPVLEGVEARIVDYKIFESEVELRIPGAHNRKNAAAACAVASVCNIDLSTIKQSLHSFMGTWRRFEHKGTTLQGSEVYDDYAHNPVKVQAVIQGARELYPDRHITIVFQPHLYSRTKYLFKKFVESFDGVDEIILLPIYAAREVFDPEISSEMLRDALIDRGQKACVVDTIEQAQKYLEKKCREGDVILTVGAGDVTRLSSILVEKPLK